MKNITMTMKAATCIPSSRPRPASPALLADVRFGDQGTTVSIAEPKGLRIPAANAPFSGVVTADATPNLTTDVVRSRSGRPPV
ncbi:MAG: hypothetical protein ABIZ07_02225 [Dermatophilaceae bacterium]